MTPFRITAAALAIALAGALSSCSTAGQDASALTFDDTVNDAVMRVAEDGTTVPVSDVVDVAWDEAALFSEGATRTEIEDVVGESGLKGDRYMSSTNLLVLRQEGEVVALIGTSADVFAGEYGVLFGTDAVFAPDDGWDGYVALTSGT